MVLKICVMHLSYHRINKVYKTYLLLFLVKPIRLIAGACTLKLAFRIKNTQHDPGSAQRNGKDESPQLSADAKYKKVKSKKWLYRPTPLNNKTIHCPYAGLYILNS